jgi:hypothetical protein
MQFIFFLQYQCSFYWRRWRWLTPIPIGLLLGYWACQVIKVLTPISFSGEVVGVETSVSGVTGNALEAFIWAFGKPEIVYFVATALFVYLVSDFLPASAYEQWILLRLRSRSKWWFAKISLVFLSTCLYAVLLFGSFFLIVLPQFPFSSEWSPAGLNNFGMGLGYAIKNGGPVQGALSTAILLLLGWFAIGLLISTINQITRLSWPGGLCGALIVVIAELGSISGGPIGGQGWLSYLLIQNHLEYTPLWTPTRIIPESASWFFWTIWIFLFIIVGWFSSKRIDIFTMEQQEER